MMAFRLALLLLPPRFRRQFGLCLRRTLADELQGAGPLAAVAIRGCAVIDVLAIALRLRYDTIAPRGDVLALHPRKRVNTMDSLLQDVRYGARGLVKSGGVSLVAVITLALGIGANTMIFSLVNGILLRPLPYAEADRLVHLWESNPDRGWPRFTVSPPNYLDWKAEAEAFEAMTGYYGSTLTLTGSGEPERLRGASVADDFFATLGVEPAMGRAFAADEFAAGRNRVVVLKRSLWARRFGSDPAIVGSDIILDGESHRVVGVLTDDAFAVPTGAELWVPVDLAEQGGISRGAHFWRVMARMKPGVTIEAATAEMVAVAARLPLAEEGWTALAASMHEDYVGRARSSLRLLLGAVGLVLLIACANVANLVLARAASRSREIQVRSAIGAGRGRLMRQILVESMLLSVAGAIAGLAVAAAGLRLVRATASESLPRLQEVTLDPLVLGFTLVVGMATGLLFGVFPALRSARQPPAASLRAVGGGDQGPEGGRLRATLVVGEVAIAVVVIAGAGLLLRTLWELQGVDPGFDTDERVAARMSLPDATYPERADRVLFYDRLSDSLAASSGVAAVGMISGMPLEGDFSISFTVPARPELDDAHASAELRTVDGGYFDALGIPLLAGRVFERLDGPDSERVVVVNRTFAETFFPAGDALDSTLDIGYAQPRDDSPRILRRVVGIVEDVKTFALSGATAPTYYLSRRQDPGSTMTVVVRSTSGTEAAIGLLRARVNEIDGQLPLYGVRSLNDLIRADTAPERFRVGLLGSFAALALGLASIGIYGTLSYWVGRRTREIGLRLAVGARPRDVRRMVLAHGLRLAVVGVLIGVGAALAAGRLLSDFLYGVPAHDPATLGAVAVFLVAVATAACWLPARRATTLDPVQSLASD